jgi:hypothetical protein
LAGAFFVAATSVPFLLISRLLLLLRIKRSLER